MLTAMRALRVSVELLADTKAGLLINQLKRRLRSPQAIGLAKELIAAWKMAVSHTAAAAAPIMGGAAAQAERRLQSLTLPTSAPSGSAPAEARKRRRSWGSSPAAAGGSSAPAAPQRSASSSASSSSPSAVAADAPPLPPSYSLSAAAARAPSSSPSSRVLRPPSPDSSPSFLSLPSPPLSSCKAALPLYNPNLYSSSTTSQLQRDGGLDEAVERQAGLEGEDEEGFDADVLEAAASSRKRTRGLALDESSLWLPSSLPPPPSCPVLVCSLVQLCVDQLSQPSSFAQLRSLGPLPAPLALAILARAPPEQLRRIEDHSHPQLRADTDPLWRAIVQRRWGSGAGGEEERQLQRMRQAAGSWRSVFDAKVKEKDERVALLGQRLRARGEEERKERRERQGIRMLDNSQASRVLHRQRAKGGGAGGGRSGVSGYARASGAAGGEGAAHAVVFSSSSQAQAASSSRLSQLRKASGAQSKSFWAKRPTA